MHTTTAIILAAGQGTRMKSALPKVMHRICGLPIIHHGIQAALDAGCDEVVVVVGHGRQAVEDHVARAFPDGRVHTALQEHQRGTGDAARAGLAAVGLAQTDRVLVVNGDRAAACGARTLQAVTAPLDRELEPNGRPALSLATCVVDDPSGYGRVIRQGGQVLLIREHRDLVATPPSAARARDQRGDLRRPTWRSCARPWRRSCRTTRSTSST